LRQVLDLDRDDVAPAVLGPGPERLGLSPVRLPRHRDGGLQEVVLVAEQGRAPAVGLEADPAARVAGAREVERRLDLDRLLGDDLPRDPRLPAVGVALLRPRERELPALDPDLDAEALVGDPAVLHVAGVAVEAVDPDLPR